MGGAQRADVVVVGGGIAGGALAVQLARAGRSVVVVEQSLAFRDRVRGETMPPWGYAEAVRSGLLDVLLRAEGTVATRSVPYSDHATPERALATALDLGALLPDVPGMLNLSHPGACQALLDEAQACGAAVVRGARRLRVSVGSAPEVHYRVDEVPTVLRPRLVVGADGRASVVRTSLELALQRFGVRTFGLGVLVEGLEDWPAGTNVLGTWDDVFYLVFPREGGRARVYLMWDRADPQRFAGRDGLRRALQRLATLECLPHAELFRQARAVGGVASFPMDDTLVPRPYGPGAVLIGDAAGWNDPIIGQGLSIALRDARLVAQALTANDEWSPAVFEEYAAERAERMRRLCATAEATTRLRADFSSLGRRQREAAFSRFVSDPAARMPIAASLVGPEVLPPEAFERAACDRMLALT